MKKVLVITVIAILVLVAAALCLPLRPDYYSSEGVLYNGSYYFSNRDVLWQYSPESGLKKAPKAFEFDENINTEVAYITVDADLLRTEYAIYNAEVMAKTDGEALVLASLPHDARTTALYIISSDGVPVEIFSPIPDNFKACYYDGNYIYAITPAYNNKIYTFRVIHEDSSIHVELLAILE